MSQPTVERVLGRLITDEAFRVAFYAQPAIVCQHEALELTSEELDALLALDPARLRGFSQALDGRIVRAAVGGAYWHTWAGRPPGALNAEEMQPGAAKRRERRTMKIVDQR